MKAFSRKIKVLFIILFIAQQSSGQINDAPKIPVPLPPVREADVMWSKRIWRVIDMREKINLPFYYPTTPANGLKSFMQVVMDALKDNQLTAYDASSDEFLIPLTYEQIITSLSRTDSMTIQRTEPPYDTYDTVIVKDFDPTAVKQIRVKEDWFFDKQRSVMDVRILGLCPIIEEYDENGEFKGYKPLFWIYYPNARNVFVQNNVFNRFNDSTRLSYDDVFMKRFFGSYIYKESNVYDRKISEYAKGMDALLESERIKNDIFNLEHDLWEY
jgi:gliding motility associated protien GldN